LAVAVQPVLAPSRQGDVHPEAINFGLQARSNHFPSDGSPGSTNECLSRLAGFYDESSAVAEGYDTRFAIPKTETKLELILPGRINQAFTWDMW
jgi:hypothetical protein